MIPNTEPVINLHNFVMSVRTSNENDSAAMAVLGMFRALLKLQNSPINTDVELSAKFLYYNLTVMAGAPGQDVGSTVTDALVSLSTIGVCTEDNWPYATPLSTPPTAQAISDAQGNKIRQSHAVSQDLASLIQCLSAAHPFAFGISTYPSTFSAAVELSGNVPLPSAAELATPTGREYMYCIGANQSASPMGFADGKQWPSNTFLCQLARGTKFGLTTMAGCVTIPFDYVTDPNQAFDFATIDVEV